MFLQNDFFKQKKTQIKFGEIFGILIIVYFIIIAGMLWYNKVNMKSIAEMQYNQKLNRALEKYYFLINLPILHRSELGNIDEKFDNNSLYAFKNFAKNKTNINYLIANLGYAKIDIQFYDLNFVNFDNLTIYNVTPKKYKNKEVFSSLIPIETDNNRVYIGKIKIINYN